MGAVAAPHLLSFLHGAAPQNPLHRFPPLPTPRLFHHAHCLPRPVLLSDNGTSILLPTPASERQKLFNRIAPAYDRLNDWLSLGQHRIWKRMAVQWSRSKAGDFVLDLCCGSGDLAFLLAEKVGPNGKVIGLDYAEEQLTIASERQKAKVWPQYRNLEWLQGDALNLPFGNELFDAVTVGYGLRNVIDISRALEEIFRVLKSGSSAAILDFNKPTNVSVRDIQNWLLDNVVVPVAANYGMREEYAYLKESIVRFPTGREQENLASDVGFSHAEHYELSGGLMGILVLRK